jgi:hypothetical protein
MLAKQGSYFELCFVLNAFNMLLELLDHGLKGGDKLIARIDFGDRVVLVFVHR